MGDYYLRSFPPGGAPPGGGIELLLYVIEDDTSPVYEHVVHDMLGRGRKEDKGTYFGIEGSITVLLREGWGGKTAHQQREDLADLPAWDDVWFYTPWDAQVPVSVEVEFSREAGGGDSDIGTAVISLKELED